VARTAVTRPFETVTVRGEGMPVHNFPSQRGNLHVKVNVDFPAGPLTDEQRDVISRLF
jgi:DnaJ-class molecular chaperone